MIKFNFLIWTIVFVMLTNHTVNTYTTELAKINLNVDNVDENLQKEVHTQNLQ